jgi:hypothetical protein
MFPMDRIREIIRAKGVLFHSDAVQVIGKLPVRQTDGGIPTPYRPENAFGDRAMGGLRTARKPATPFGDGSFGF